MSTSTIVWPSGGSTATSGTGFTSPGNMSNTTSAGPFTTNSTNSIKGDIWGNFGFDSAIAVGSTINSVAISASGKTSVSTNSISACARISGADQTAHTASLNTTYAAKGWDVTADRSWTRSDLLDANFQVVVRSAAIASGTASLDNLTVVVGYTTSVTNNQSMTVTVTVNPSIIKQVGKTVSQTVTVNPSILKSVGKLLTQTVTATATILKSVGKTVKQTVTANPTLVTGRAYVKALSVTVTATPSITWNLIRAQAMSVTVTVNGLFGPKTIGKFVSQTVTVTPSFLKAMTHTLSQTVTASGSVLKQCGKNVSQTVTATPRFIKSVGKVLSQTVTATPSLAAHVVVVHQVVMSVTVTVVSSLCWCIARGLAALHAGVLAITGNLLSSIGLSTADPSPISLTPIDPGTEPISTLDPTHISDPTVEGCDCE